MENLLVQAKPITQFDHWPCYWFCMRYKVFHMLNVLANQTLCVFLQPIFAYCGVKLSGVHGCHSTACARLQSPKSIAEATAMGAGVKYNWEFYLENNRADKSIISV